jgi:hypothetical protein
MFEDQSRYKDKETYVVRDRRGRTVRVVSVPEAPRQSLLGFHLLKQGQRMDHLAYRYLNDGAGFWRIAEANEAMLPESLSEQSEIAIPNKR